MNHQLRLALAIGMISYFGACAPVKFETLPKDGKGVVTRCENQVCTDTYTEERMVGEGLVDILIVNDNSGSMSFEQAKMANAFTGFIDSLGSLNWRLAMTTTDISSPAGTRPDSYLYNPSTAYNGYGALQDGKLIDFGGGQKYLAGSPASTSTERANNNSKFNATIKRQETINCESSGFTQCPSGDERGIFAANLALQNHAGQFARPTAHFAVVILSDEDERGISSYNPSTDSNDMQVKQMYPLESMDHPQTLIDRSRSLFPEKTMSVHSIIVRPGDSSCFNSQIGQVAGNPWIRGSYGFAYQHLSQLTGGVVGNICASNYTTQLQQIGMTIQNQVTSIPFRCRPINDDYDVTFTPQPASAVNVTADFSRMLLKIDSVLPPMTKVKLTYTCVSE